MQFSISIDANMFTCEATNMNWHNIEADVLLLPFTEGCAVQDRARDMLGLVAETHCLKCAFYREIQGMLSKSISDMA